MIHTIIFIYTIVASTYLTYRVALLLFEKKNEKGHVDGRVSIIIPVYNEVPSILDGVIYSALKTGYKVIVVDDYSDKYNERYEMLKKKYENVVNFKWLNNKYEKGKRQAQRTGIEYVKSKYVVMIDSDTYIDKKGVDLLICQLKDKAIGGATANVKVYNKNENLLTKIIDFRYSYAFDVERCGQSAFGIVTCLSGVMSAYRRKDILPLMEEYTNQEFMGKKQEVGDDRALTTMLLKKGFKTVMVKEAEAHTYVPNEIGGYVRQQIRWKQSFIRESLLLLSINPLKRPLLYFDNFLSLLVTYYSQIIRGIAVYYVALYPAYLLYVSALIVFIAMVRNFPYLIYDKRKYFYGILYGFLYEGIISWLLIPATFNLFFRKSRWLTR